ncbi:hypothetical protein E3U23_06245 [Erythrobacter litoralis]|uniref:hypothetical protein n=1 Tax=Erythrobacter litoralis TaxID=39960 RepID=UPI0024355DA9|nr:hypothetical protein [Erythrobacter litoralis]MDG6078792.1 hypothetical protein [Erythrobacter litoralis]
MKKLAIVLSVLGLAACGQQAQLQPVAPQTLPPAPYGAETRPEADELLQLDPLAAPERSVELRTRSEEREDDPFDLPPE